MIIKWPAITGLFFFLAPAIAGAWPRPIHWWSGNRISLVDIETADLVDGFCIHYTGPFRPELEAKKGYRQVGCLGPLSCTLPSIIDNYNEGARKLCIDPEDWDIGYTVEDAINLCATVNALPGIEVVVYTTWMLWPQDARDVLEDCSPLLLLEMAYCTAEGRNTYEECYSLLIDYLSHYTHRSPGIGLSVYTSHACTEVVSLDLMKTQIDAAIDAAGSWGSPDHTIFIFDGDIMTDEFANEVNRYIDGHPPPAGIPQVQILEPADNTTVGKEVLSRWTSSDDVEITGHDLFLDGDLVASLGGGAEIHLITGLSRQWHTLNVTAHDNDGNEGMDEVSFFSAEAQCRRLRVEVVVDGDMGDWDDISPMILGTSDYVVLSSETTGTDDLAARVYSAFDDEAFYIAARVTDERHTNTFSGTDIWQGDCLQFALDADHDAAAGGYDNDGDFEYGLALTGSGAAVYRWKAPDTAPPENVEVFIRRNGSDTIYEARFQATELAPLQPEAGDVIGFNVVVMDRDGAELDGWMQWTPGITGEKAPLLFGDLVFVDPVPDDDAYEDDDYEDVELPDAPDIETFPEEVDAGPDQGPHGAGGGCGCSLLVR